MRITFKSNRGINLVGILENPKAKKCIILVHGFLENKNSHHWINLSKELQKENFSVFRFDFGGCGDSEQTAISIEGQDEDLKSAIELMRKKFSLVGVVGHSLGGLCSLKLGNKFDALVGWAPATDHMIPKSLQKIPKIDDGENYVVTIDNKKYLIAKKLVEERKSINQKELIGNLKIPILIIHGEQDQMVPVRQALRAKKFLKNGEVKIIPEENHFFTKNPERIINLTVEWIKHNI